jgi:hypothetical protein
MRTTERSIDFFPFPESAHAVNIIAATDHRKTRGACFTRPPSQLPGALSCGLPTIRSSRERRQRATGVLKSKQFGYYQNIFENTVESVHQPCLVGQSEI